MPKYFYYTVGSVAGMLALILPDHFDNNRVKDFFGNTLEERNRVE